MFRTELVETHWTRVVLSCQSTTHRSTASVTLLSGSVSRTHRWRSELSLVASRRSGQSSLPSGHRPLRSLCCRRFAIWPSVTNVTRYTLHCIAVWTSTPATSTKQWRFWRSRPNNVYRYYHGKRN